MLAVVYDGSGLRLVNRTRPRINSDEALLKINIATLCVTDLRILNF